MTNAKKELQRNLKNLSPIKCAKIRIGYDYGENDNKIYLLKVNHNEKDLKAFLKELDFEYDSGYGGQELYGKVWLTDGTWLDRGEYDGSEWWEHQSCPEIPEEIL